MLALPWHGAIGIKHLKTFPLSLHQIHDFLLEENAQIEKKFCTWGYWVSFKIFPTLDSDCIYQFLEKFNIFDTWTESSVSWLVDFGSRGYTVKSNEEYFLRIDCSDNLEHIINNFVIDLFNGERFDFVFEEAVWLLYLEMIYANAAIDDGIEIDIKIIEGGDCLVRIR